MTASLEKNVASGANGVWLRAATKGVDRPTIRDHGDRPLCPPRTALKSTTIK